VRDMEAPSIDCPVAVTVAAEAGQNHAGAVSLGTPATSDNCQVAGVTNDAPSQFPLGTNVVTWTVTDAAGNQNTCTQQVIVNAAPALPHSVAGLVRNPDGTCTVSFLGTPQVSYTVQVTSNLVDWVSIQTNSASEDGTWSYLDLEAANIPIRFYRAVRF